MLNPNIKSEQSGFVFFNYTVIITLREQKGHLCDELEGKINHLTTFDSTGWWTSWGWGFTYNCDIYTLNVSLKYLSANEMIGIKYVILLSDSGVKTFVGQTWRLVVQTSSLENPSASWNKVRNGNLGIDALYISLHAVVSISISYTVVKLLTWESC